MTTRWPDSRTAVRKPGKFNGLQGRSVHEARNARISILVRKEEFFEAGYVEADWISRDLEKPLADGAGHYVEPKNGSWRIGGSDALAVCDFSRFGCISSVRGGAGAEEAAVGGAWKARD